MTESVNRAGLIRKLTGLSADFLADRFLSRLNCACGYAFTAARNSGLRPEYGRFRPVVSESDKNDDRLRF